MRTIFIIPIAFIVSQTCFGAGTFEVKGWSGCVQEASPGSGILIPSQCHTEGRYETNNCEEAYNELRAQDCCAEKVALRERFYRTSCIAISGTETPSLPPPPPPKPWSIIDLLSKGGCIGVAGDIREQRK